MAITSTTTARMTWQHTSSSDFNSVTDNGGIDYSVAMSGGTGIGNINQIYYDHLAVTGGTDVLNLHDLTQNILNYDNQVSYSGGDIKVVEFVNINGTGTIEVGLKYGVNNHVISNARIIIPESGSFINTNIIGWGVSGDNTISVVSTESGNLLIGIIGVSG